MTNSTENGGVLASDEPESGDGERIGSQAGRALASKVTSSFGKAFDDVLLTDKSFDDIFRSLATSIESALIQSIAQTTVKSLLSSSGLVEAGSSLLGGLSGAFSFADGGVMTASGALPLNTYASGGIADSPQLALFGEGRTAEAYVPLPDGRSIPVQMQGGEGGQRAVSVVNNITVNASDAGSFRRSEGQIGAEIAAKLQRSLRRYG